MLHASPEIAEARLPRKYKATFSHQHQKDDCQPAHSYTLSRPLGHRQVWTLHITPYTTLFITRMPQLLQMTPAFTGFTVCFCNASRSHAWYRSSNHTRAHPDLTPPLMPRSHPAPAYLGNMLPPHQGFLCAVAAPCMCTRHVSVTGPCPQHLRRATQPRAAPPAQRPH